MFYRGEEEVGAEHCSILLTMFKTSEFFKKLGGLLVYNIPFKHCPVYDPLTFATTSGVPSARS